MPLEFLVLFSGRLVVMLPDHLDAGAYFVGHAGHVSETGNLVRKGE